MALFRFSEARSQPANVGITKTAMRRIISSKDEKIELEKADAALYRAEADLYKYKVEDLTRLLGIAEKERKWAWIVTGVLLGYDVVFTIVWYCTSGSS